VFQDERIVTVVAIGWKPREQPILRGRSVVDAPDEELNP
jgi:hypothetical protein